MRRSMTPFARHEQLSAWCSITRELRAVNRHRYLELRSACPRRCGVWSRRPANASRCGKLSRGKVEGTLKLQTTGAALQPRSP